MISKKNFIKLMAAMKKQTMIDEKATDHLQQIFDDVIGGFYNNETLYSAMREYLIEIFKDTGGWIEYFIYDLSWGTCWTEDSCSEKNGEIINISTIEKLYDFLIKNMEK